MEIHINEKRLEADYINSVVEQFRAERYDIAYPEYENDLNVLKLQNRSLWERFNSLILRAGAISWHSSCSAPFVKAADISIPNIIVPDECTLRLAELWTKLEENSLRRECRACKIQVHQYLEDLKKQVEQQMQSMSEDIETQMERPSYSMPKPPAPKSDDVWSELKDIQQNIALLYERIDKLLATNDKKNEKQEAPKHKKISFEIPNLEPAEPLKTLDIGDSQISSADLLHDANNVFGI